MTFTSSTKYIDIDTGEQITKHQATGKNSQYIIIKTIKHGKTDYIHGKHHTEYTRLCKRDPQQRLELS